MEPRPHRPGRADSSAPPSDAVQDTARRAAERRRVFYSGHVQGVGFRMVSQHLAWGFDVSGSVRNLPDGRVELVAEGEAAEVAAFLAEIRRAFAGKIQSEEATTEPLSEHPGRGFVIRT
jgi:acylphosphatase